MLECNDHVVLVLGIVGCVVGAWEILKWSFKQEEERWAKVDEEVMRRMEEL